MSATTSRGSEPFPRLTGRHPAWSTRDSGDPEGPTSAKLLTWLELARTIAADAATAPDPDTYLRRLRGGLTHLGFKRAGIWIIDPRDPAVLRGTWGTDWDGTEKDERGIALAIGSDLDSRRIMDGEGVVLRHLPLLVEPDRPPHLLPPPTAGPPNHVSVALRADGQLLGLIGVDMLPTGQTIDAVQIAALELVAAIVAIALAHGRAGAQLRESEARYRTISEMTSDFIYSISLLDDGTTRVDWISHLVERIIGYSPAEMMRPGVASDIVHPDDQHLVRRDWEAILAGQTTEIECRVVAKGGQIKWLRVRSQPEWDAEHRRVARVYGAARDVTEWKRLGLELRQAQKLEAVGRLAAGIAHEINTPIQFVGDNTRFLQDSLAQIFRVVEGYRTLRAAVEPSPAVDPGLLDAIRTAEDEADLAYLQDEIPKALAETLNGVERVATIVRSLKEFAHPDSGEQSPADLNRALLSTLTVARNELKYVAEVETELETLPLVTCHIGELNQVFLNLLINAAHAVADARRDGLGRIAVRTWRDGDLARVSIRDSGCGIPEAIRPRIFDPFFTTKEVGRGTGQGLALARAVVVDKHRGTIEFETEVGVGTTFVIGLPIEGNASRPG